GGGGAGNAFGVPGGGEGEDDPASSAGQAVDAPERVGGRAPGEAEDVAADGALLDEGEEPAEVLGLDVPDRASGRARKEPGRALPLPHTHDVEAERLDRPEPGHAGGVLPDPDELGGDGEAMRPGREAEVEGLRRLPLDVEAGALPAGEARPPEGGVVRGVDGHGAPPSSSGARSARRGRGPPRRTGGGRSRGDGRADGARGRRRRRARGGARRRGPGGR